MKAYPHLTTSPASWLAAEELSWPLPQLVKVIDGSHRTKLLKGHFNRVKSTQMAWTVSKQTDRVARELLDTYKCAFI